MQTGQNRSLGCFVITALAILAALALLSAIWWGTRQGGLLADAPQPTPTPSATLKLQVSGYRRAIMETIEVAVKAEYLRGANAIEFKLLLDPNLVKNVSFISPPPQPGQESGCEAVQDAAGYTRCWLKAPAGESLQIDSTGTLMVLEMQANTHPGILNVQIPWVRVSMEGGSPLHADGIGAFVLLSTPKGRVAYFPLLYKEKDSDTLPTESPSDTPNTP